MGPKTVRCKFKVDSNEITGDEACVKLSAVTSGSEENAAFFKYTPSGQLSLGVVNKAAAEQLEVGKEYYLDITPAG